MKFGEMTKGGDDFFQNHDLEVSGEGGRHNFICFRLTQLYKCVETSSSSIADFFADGPNQDYTSFTSSFLITDLVRFEYYRGSPYGFVKEEGDNSSMYAGTCETF